jgi:hypothetical protein
MTTSEVRTLLLEIGALLDRCERTERHLKTILEYVEEAMRVDCPDNAYVITLRAALMEIAEQADLGTRICRETLDEFHTKP